MIHPERCPSGRRNTIGNRVGGKLPPGFESPPLRQLDFKLFSQASLNDASYYMVSRSLGRPAGRLLNSLFSLSTNHRAGMEPGSTELENPSRPESPGDAPMFPILFLISTNICKKYQIGRKDVGTSSAGGMMKFCSLSPNGLTHQIRCNFPSLNGWMQH